MGWKGTIRTIGAAARRAERDSKRRQMELEKRKKQYEKMQELEQAAYEVDVYENHIEVIQSLHKECSPVIDWMKIAKSEKPKEPKKYRAKEESARLKLDNYSPGFFDRLFKLAEKKRISLVQEIEKSIKLDEENYNKSIAGWKLEVEEWVESVNMASALLKGDAKAKIEAIENMQPFSEISNLGSSLKITVHENGLLEATINVHGEKIVPSEAKSLLKSGKLSVKAVPKGRFNEIYQDYVCSCILRIANELFSTIPDKLVIVTAVDKLLNTKTGHLEVAPILSAAISRNTINGLNLEKIDPSDSMNNFIHNMSFKNTKGFGEVDRINPDNLSS